MNIQDFDLKKILPTVKFWLLICVSVYSHNQHIKLTALFTINNSHTYKLLSDMWSWTLNEVTDTRVIVVKRLTRLTVPLEIRGAWLSVLRQPDAQRWGRCDSDVRRSPRVRWRGTCAATRSPVPIQLMQLFNYRCPACNCTAADTKRPLLAPP